MAGGGLGMGGCAPGRRSHWDDGPSAALADHEKLFRVLRALGVEGAIPALTTVWTARHFRPRIPRTFQSPPPERDLPDNDCCMAAAAATTCGGWVDAEGSLRWQHTTMRRGLRSHVGLS